jgi:hypothetical protein
MESDSLKELYEFIEADCQNMLDSPQDTSTKRFFIAGIEHLLQKSPKHETMRFFQSIKLLARGSHAIFVLSLDPRCLTAGHQSCLRIAESYFDFVLEFGSIHSRHP